MKKIKLSWIIALLVVAVLGYYISLDSVTVPNHSSTPTQSEVTEHKCDGNCSHALVDQAGQSRGGEEKSIVVIKAITDTIDATLAYGKWEDTATPPAKDIQDTAKAPAELGKEFIQQGIDLAKKRKESMLILMRTAPEEAIKRAISWDEYKSLPEEIKPHFEVPFSCLGDFDVIPNCGSLNGQNKQQPAANHKISIADKYFETTCYGRRMMNSTKENTPLQGIHLDGVAVLRSTPLQKLSLEEARVLLGHFPAANSEITRDFSTGEAISGKPVVALGGGKLFYFSNEAELDATNQKIEKLDELPGPHSGAQSFFLQASGTPNNDVDSLDWPAIEYAAQFQASSWTETEKKVFFIRVDFSDNTGESTSQANLEQVLDTDVSDSIRDMSYGKTWITADVSSMVVRLPSPTTTYLPSDNDLLRDDAIAAFNALLNTGIDLGVYDIVGVHFKSIGMTSSSGLNYAGLAGGSRQWLQGTTSAGVIIHEFGHNYGLGHARFWDTGGTSVIGAGSTVEYGNSFDIMGSGPDPEGHFHSQAKAKLNWLEVTDWADTAITGSATHRLYRSDNKDTAGIRGIRAPKDTGIDHFYWMGYRRGLTDNNYLQNGIVLNWEQSGSSWLLDTTPGSAQDKVDSAVLIGQTYSDSASGVHITPIAQGGISPNEWIDVTVNNGNSPGNSAPTATLSGPSSGDARNSLVFSVTANDADGDTLAYSWDFGDSAEINNQSTAPHTWDLGGNYNVEVTISDMKGGTVTKSMSVTVTDPLNNWTVGNVGFTANMSEASYINGRYILTGDDYVYFSLDGVNWSRSFLSNNYVAGGIAYGNGKYVITGWDWVNSAWKAVAFHSNDGKNWTKGTVPLMEYMNDVAYGNGRFVAVGNNGENMYSTDGITWTAGTTVGGQDLAAVSFANGEFIAVGDNTVHASSDGISWVDRSGSTGLASWHNLRDVFYADGKFFAGGFYSGIRYSSDQGVTWQAAAMPAGVDYDIETIHIAEGVYAAVAKRMSDNTGVLLVSSDGMSWQEGTPTNFILTSTLTYGNGVYFSTQGSAGATQYSDALYPSNQAPTTTISGDSSVNAREVVQFTSTSNDADGDDLILIWDFQDGTELVTGSSAYHKFPTGGTYTVKLSAVDGRGGLTTDTLVVTVTDPLDNWTQRTSGTTAELYDITYGGGKLVAVGGSSGNRGAYRVSTDAITWSGGVLGGNIRFNAVAHDETNFIAAGYDYDFDILAWVGVVYTSPDGSTWTRRHFAGEELRDISFENGVYVATGDTGTILRSTDGLVWNSVSSGVTTNLQGVNYGDGGFVIVGASSSSKGATILKSTDGLAWSDTSAGAGTSQGFFHVEYMQDRFMASGFHTRLRYSTDGGSTMIDTQAGNLQTPAMAYGNGVYFVAGWDLDNSSAHINMLSTDGEAWSDLTTSATVDRNAAVFFQNTFITVGDAGEIWQSDPISSPSGWTVWQAQQFPGYPPLSGPADDFDNDGVANLIEYITGTNPKDGGSHSNPVLSEESGYMTLTMNKTAGVSGFTLIIESSDDLDIWNTTGLTVVTDDASILKVRFNQLITDPSLLRGFLRAKATLTP